MEHPWYWEGHVVHALARWLREDGWEILAIADTESRESGPDLHAKRLGRSLFVEAKGYPLAVYERGEKRGQKKRTNAPTQARHWYGEALLTTILKQPQHPAASFALAFPDFPVYRDLFRRTRDALQALQLGLYFLKETGLVDPALAMLT